MIIRRNLKWSIILKNTWPRLLAAAVLALLAPAVDRELEFTAVRIPFPAIATLGTALAIFLAFRNNTSYDRWWEARKLWGQLINSSRSFGRQILTFVETDAATRTQILHRQAAYAHALRLHLRGHLEQMDGVQPLLNAEEFAKVRAAQNVPLKVLTLQAEQLAALRKSGALTEYSHVAIDHTLTVITDVQGACERIKNTPLPRQYDFFPRVFYWLYLVLLPFALVSELGYRTIVLAVPIAFLFGVLEGIGRLNEDPFDNRITDTPMSALSRTIEINLRELNGESPLPAPLQPVDGFLM